MDITDKILSYLEDEESRFIYQKRVEYSETGNMLCINEIVSRYVPKLNILHINKGDMEREILKLLNDKKSIVVFGSGVNSKEILKLLLSHGRTIESIVDNDQSKWGQKMEGIEIKCPQDIAYDNVDAVIITPSQQTFVDQIHEQIKQIARKKELFFIDYNYYKPRILEHEQYFDPGIIHFRENEIFIDAGALDLSTSIRFSEECRKNGVNHFKIHSFEPDDISYKRCMEIQKKIPDVDLQLHHAGLWSENTTLYFTECGTGGSRITQQKTSTSIDTVSLDNCILDEVTYIKLDIEGAELEALKGAKKIIQKYKPRLAVCIYHKKEDLIEIPQYLKELVPEYKFYVRHYSNTTWETVLYAVR